MSVSISHQFSVLAEDGVTPHELEQITILVKNRANVAQQTFGPATGLTATLPSWLTRDTTTGVYTFTTDLDTTNYSYPEDFVILDISAIDRTDPPTDTTAGVHQFTQVATFASTSVPTVATSRTPYASLTFASAYFALRLGQSEIWNSYGAYQLTQALVTASDDIDTEKYGGRIYHTALDSQQSRPRQFPRSMTEHHYLGVNEGTSDSLTDENTGIPVNVRYACCEQAMYLLLTLGRGQDPNDRRNMQAAGVTGFSQGRQGEQYDLSRAAVTRICPAAYDLLAPYLLRGADYGYAN